MRRDLREAREAMVHVLTQEEQHEFVAEALARLDHAAHLAWDEYHGATTPSLRLRALPSARRAVLPRVSTLLRLGILRSEPVSVPVAGGAAPIPWTEEVRERVAKALIEDGLEPLAEATSAD